MDEDARLETMWGPYNLWIQYIHIKTVKKNPIDSEKSWPVPKLENYTETGTELIILENIIKYHDFIKPSSCWTEITRDALLSK